MYDSIKQRIKDIFYKPDPITASMKRYLESLDYDWSEFTLNGFIEWLANSLGEPIVLIPCQMPNDICGAYVIGPSNRHLILFDGNLPQMLRLHTILHEIAHLLCGHQTASLDHDEMLILDSTSAGNALRGQNLSELAINRNPSSKNNRQEQEAETLAILIQNQVQKAKDQHQIYTPTLYDELISFWK